MQRDLINIFPEEIKNNFSTTWSNSQTRPKICDYPKEIQEEAIKIFKKMGYDSLFTHQAASIKAILNGSNVLVATGTASGKSLCYQIPIISSLLEDKKNCSLLLYPTKALSGDQFKSFLGFVNSFQEFASINSQSSILGVYDGDTNPNLRNTIRNNSRIVITNPDMLHMGILPHHPGWHNLLSNLKYVVVDEAHSYSGVFGSHFANVIRRLKRISKYYGTSPQFILTSATIGNPKEFSESLIEENIKVFDKDFSAKSKRTYVFYNPPVINKELGVRRSLSTESMELSKYLLKNNLQTILFTRSRLSVENLYRKFIQLFNHEKYAIEPYRSGYRKDERRYIENGLKSGKINLVISTIALELGIDMGMVDVVLMNGYPGSISKFIQQSGRAGRKNKPSLCIFVAAASPLDQYMVNHSEYIKDKNPENVFIDANNPYILFNHIRCASFELPFLNNESFGLVSENQVNQYLNVLVEIDELFRDENKYYWMTEGYPASDISIRSSLGFSYILYKTEHNSRKKIGDIDPKSVNKIAHPGAIYFHKGDPFLVDSVDPENRQILIKQVDSLKYTTEPIVHSKASTGKQISSLQDPNYIKVFGETKVIEEVRGYKKLFPDTNEIIAIQDLDLPPEILDTKGLWISFSKNIIRVLTAKNLWNNSPNDYGPNWPKIRQQILARDDFTCQLCEKKFKLSDLHVHHKEPFRSFISASLANKPDNLITLCKKCHSIAENNLRIRSTLNGLGYALANLTPVFINCDRQDIGFTIIDNLDKENNSSGLLLFDQFPGGIGLAENIYLRLDEIFSAIYNLVLACPCMDGCPACVGPGGENGSGAKEGVFELLKIIVGNNSNE